ncbi:uncharacterized protein LOC123006156 isoform X2 [Tribolium madens]|nr:uncharacterized protein LOC123006156 isoform X2 [Tribolium madens]
MVQFYLNNYSSFEFPVDVLKSLKIFISQIFIVSHLTLAKTDKDLNLHSEFLNFIYQFCLSRISDPETCEVSAQLLKILWDIAFGSSADLVTCYRIDLDCIYKVGGNLYFKKLQSSGFWEARFKNPELTNKFAFLLEQKFFFCPKLSNVIKERYFDVVNCDFDLVTLLIQINQLVYLQSSETIRLYTDLVISYRKLKNKNSFSSETEKLYSIFNDTMEKFDFEKMFTSVLILDMFIVIKSHYNIELVLVIDRSLCFVAKILNKKLDTNLNLKEMKILEAFINNIIECLITSKNDWPKFNKESIFSNLSKIIIDSNMKKPVSLSVGAIRTLGSTMENSADREIKIKLLDRTLKSLYHNKQTGKIRRNPETRLVIHALCLSDKNLTKPFLVSSLNFLLEVLSNPLSPDFVLSSSLHSLEMLVSDNSIHQFTLPFISVIIQNCIQIFNKTNWIVRNANLQLLKSLIERFLGVSLDENIRPKTIQDLFILFPTLVPCFYKILCQNELSDSAVITLLFFSESQILNNSFIGDALEDDFDKFRHLFVKIIQKYSNNLGFLAIKAFTSLCAFKNISGVFSEIIFYIQRKFERMPRNVLANLIKLLQELYQKYKLVLIQTDEIIIKKALGNLTTYLKQFDSFYFNLLSLRLHTVDEILEEIVISLNSEINYEKRIWLNNYVPYIMRNINQNRLSIFLERISCQTPEFLQVRILSILVDRINEINVAPIMKILILKLSKLLDCSKFLIMSYAKTILLCSETVHGLNCDNLITRIRQDFQTESIYKMFIYVFVLSHCSSRTNKDSQFLTKCVKKYVDAIGDDEILFDLASTLIYLYKSSSIGDRYNVMKMAFHLLLNEQTAFEICKFISLLTKFHSSSILISFANLCDLSKLSTWVGDKKLALKLLAEFYCYVNDLPNEEASDTYYLIENDLSLPKRYVKAILLKSLSDCK